MNNTFCRTWSGEVILFLRTLLYPAGQPKHLRLHIDLVREIDFGSHFSHQLLDAAK
jgi:hypothetical protein